MSVGDLSSDFEIDHISISNCPIAGVYAKTDPDCSRTSLRENFTQYNTVFHNNYISNTGNEGMYIGSSFYSGETIDCDGQRINVFPSLLSGVKVYNNIVKYTGWDGIQIGSASTDCEIMNNLVMYDSQAGVDFQMSGILIGGGSQCDCYNNYIYRGKGDAVESLGLGNYKVYNNVIIDPGYNYYPDDPSKMKYGIYVNDVSCITGNSFSILFNDIINPKTNGIRFSSTRSKKNLIASNVIINPGKGSTGYIVLTSPSCDVLQKNNYLSMTKKAAGFADTTYSLLITSPLKINSFPFTDPPGSKLTITYTIDSIRDVSMDVYNLNGEQVSHFNQTKMSSGTHNFKLDITSFPDGVVLYTIRAGKEALSGKFVKVK